MYSLYIHSQPSYFSVSGRKRALDSVTGRTRAPQTSYPVGSMHSDFVTGRTRASARHALYFLTVHAHYRQSTSALVKIDAHSSIESQVKVPIIASTRKTGLKRGEKRREGNLQKILTNTPPPTRKRRPRLLRTIKQIQLHNKKKL